MPILLITIKRGARTFPSSKMPVVSLLTLSIFSAKNSSSSTGTENSLHSPSKKKSDLLETISRLNIQPSFPYNGHGNL